MEWRFADGNYDLFPALAEEIVRLQVSAIVLGSTAAVRPTQRVTTTIPIVMGIAVDPVANGFVQSLAHPGGNTTGLASSVEDTSSKQIELLATTLPKLSRVGLLANTASPITAIVLKGAQAFAQGAGVTIEVANASNPQNIDGAISTLKKARVGGILVIPDALFMTNRLQIANFALAAADVFFSARIRRGWWSAELWRKSQGLLPICGQDFERCQARRLTDRATNAVFPRDQPQDCENPWARSATDTARGC